MSSRSQLNHPLLEGDRDRPTDRPRWRASNPGEKENRSINNNVSDDLNNSKIVDENSNSQEDKKKQEAYKPQYIWFNIISIGILHLVGLYATLNSLYCMMPATTLWGLFLGGAGGFGVTGGVHRLWTHRSYKAKWPLRVILAICYSMAGQNTIFDWVRDHRVHHKFSETDADPHNANRGFFFAHVGWLMEKKHPDVVRKGKLIDMSDILDDPVVQFHAKYFTPLKLIFCFAIPILVPHYAWHESWYYSIMGPGIFRYLLNLNFTWSVNSAAHIWGNKPFDRRIGPAENITVAIASMGEGWHNYHHTFPWDYKAAELGNYRFNLTTFWLDMFAKIGWAYDCKSASAELVRRMAERYGDGTHPHHGHRDEVPPPEEDSFHGHYDEMTSENDDTDCVQR